MTADSLFSLENKTILITGATSGIGLSSAKLCANLGATLILTGRDGEELDKLNKELNDSRHNYYAGDLLDVVWRNKLIRSLPHLDGLVFSAGVAEIVPIRMITEEHINRVMGINFYVPVLLTKGILAQKKLNSNASVVFISAITDKSTPAATSIYSASKNALLAFSRTFALEHARQKIRSNCICPGYVNTPMLSNLLKIGLTGPELSPLGIIEPVEIANGVVFLLSDASSWVTRSNLVIDAGMTIASR